MDGRRVWDSKALGDIAEDGETQRTRRGRAYSLKDDRGLGQCHTMLGRQHTAFA